MAEEIRQKEFSFSEKEAEAAARCELGVGDLPRKALFWAALIILLSIGARILLDMPLPSLKMTGMYGAAVLAWALFLVYIRIRLRDTARELAKRTLYLTEEENGFTVHEFSTEMRYHARFEEITAVEKGEYICRITSPMGRICIPVRAMSSGFRDALDSLEGAQHMMRDWM